MIVPMAKAFAVCRREDRDELLAALRRLGVMHLIRAQPETEEEQLDEEEQALADAERALQILQGIEPEGPVLDVPPIDAALEVLELRTHAANARARLDALRREAREAELWGDVRTEQVQALRDAGVDLQLYVVPEPVADRVEGDVVRNVRKVDRYRVLLATVGVDADTLPKEATPVPLPARDRPAIQAEARELEQRLDEDRRQLAQLAHLMPALRRERDRLREAVMWNHAVRGGLGAGDLFAVQGWVPEEKADSLVPGLQAAGIEAAVRIRPPEPEEEPPTLMRPPAWARPIQGLFEMLGMVPGYDEPDVSGVFIVSLPVFAGMIIGDAGYGLLFLLAGVLLNRWFAEQLGRDPVVLLLLFGGAALIWGAISGVWFGLTPAEIATVQGVVGSLGAALGELKLIRGEAEYTRTVLIKLCFVLGAIHLIIARIRRAIHIFPSQRSVEEAGWAIVLAAMLGLIWILFFGQSEAVPEWVPRAVAWGLVGGLALVVAFRAPGKGLLRRLGLGIAGSLLPLTGTFSDTLSYIRLMAVGLASYYLGSTFNTLAASVADVATWVAAAPVLVVGHGLNIGLILVAIFAHGLRLNVLEFSNAAGIRWSGYAYRPFARLATKER